MLAEGWNGTRWATQPRNKQPALVLAYGISCTWAKDCMTVGMRGSVSTLAEQWNGSTWAIVSTPNPAAFGTLDPVSCTSASLCVAVGGDAATATGSVRPLVEVWNGSTWTQQAAPR